MLEQRRIRQRLDQTNSDSNSCRSSDHNCVHYSQHRGADDRRGAVHRADRYGVYVYAPIGASAIRSISP